MKSKTQITKAKNKRENVTNNLRETKFFLKKYYKKREYYGKTL